MQLGSFLVSGETMYSLHSIEPRVVRIVESCWSSANLCLLAFQRWEKDLGIPHRSWLTDGNPLCGWARATSQTSIWLEEDLRAVVETPQRPKTPTADIQFAAEPLALLHAPEDDKEEPTAEHEEDEEMQGGASGHKRDTRSVELRQRREAHRNTRKYVREETSDDEITEAAGYTCFTT